MRFLKKVINVAPVICVASLVLSAGALGQSTDKSKGDSAKAAIQVKHLKLQTTCPVTGDPINKKLYVDYKTKRIYVCCSSCLDAVKKEPEKYIKKLENMGQGVETIGEKPKKDGKDVKADTSMKGMDMNGMKMTVDTTAKTAQAGYWTCPMHPEVHQSTAGQCPICGMNLVFKKNDKDETKMQGMDHGKMKM
jgi:hypothetical protein